MPHNTTKIYGFFDDVDLNLPPGEVDNSSDTTSQQNPVTKDNNGGGYSYSSRIGVTDLGHFQDDEDDDHDSLEAELVNLDYTFRPIVSANEREPLFLSPPYQEQARQARLNQYHQYFNFPSHSKQTNMAGISDYNRGNFPASGRVSAGYAIYDGDSGFQRSSASEAVFGYAGRSASRNENFEGYGPGPGYNSPRMPYYGPGTSAVATDQIDFSGAPFDRKTPTRHFSLPINTPPGSASSQPDSPEGALIFSFRPGH